MDLNNMQQDAATGDNAEPVSGENLPQDPQQQKPTESQMPQADINDIVTRESRKAVEKLLRDAGIMPDENPEMQLKEYKKWQDSQKTELEKAQSNERLVASERDAALRELAEMKRNMAAVSKGIPADKAERYIKLAETYISDDVDFDAALESAIKDFPPAAKNEPPSRGGTHIGGDVEQKLDMNTFLRTQG